MDYLRKGFFLAVALMLAAFSVPSMAAAGKFYTVTVGPDATMAGITDVNWNNSPSNTGGSPGSSNINSVKLLVPAGVAFTVTGWTSSSSKGSMTFNGVAAVLGSPSSSWDGHAAVTVALSNIVGTAPGSAFQLFLQLATNLCSGGATPLVQGLAWTGNTWGGTQFTESFSGASIAPLPCSGQLGCDTTAPANTTGSNIVGNPNLAFDSGTPGWVITRDTINGGDNVCTTPVPFTFTFNPNGNTAAFNVPLTTKPENAWVEYTVVWSPQVVPANTSWPPNQQPQLSWGTVGNNPPQPGTSDFVPALPCTDDVFGTLIGDSMPYIPNIAPYNTSPFAQYRPFLADGVTKQKALVCVAQHGWTSVGPDASGNAQIQFFDVVIDKADAWITK